MTRPNLQRPEVSTHRALTYTRFVPGGRCMTFVWRCLDGWHVYGIADADSGWRQARERHTDSDPPPGVPVYWAGHVALSLGARLVRTTDWPKRRQVATVSIDMLTETTGMVYEGWTSDYGGHRIPGLAS